ncbi:MAG: DUF948 domain-containing protein [Ignavibacteriales bacterium]|nr:DUF948 domain-containing protein [Ignavibacteriales bacterium]
METLIHLSIILALFSASALCIYLIVVLTRFNAFLQILQRELVDLNKNLKPILENINTMTDKLRLIASKVDEQVNMVQGVFVAFKRITENVTRFEERFQQMLEEPLLRVSALFGNVINRVVSLLGRRSQDIF